MIIELVPPESFTIQLYHGRNLRIALPSFVKTNRLTVTNDSITRAAGSDNFMPSDGLTEGRADRGREGLTGADSG